MRLGSRLVQHLLIMRQRLKYFTEEVWLAGVALELRVFFPTVVIEFTLLELIFVFEEQSDRRRVRRG
jgi:hypothetical protein